MVTILKWLEIQKTLNTKLFRSIISLIWDTPSCIFVYKFFCSFTFWFIKNIWGWGVIWKTILHWLVILKTLNLQLFTNREETWALKSSVLTFMAIILKRVRKDLYNDMPYYPCLLKHFEIQTNTTLSCWHTPYVYSYKTNFCDYPYNN